MSSLNRPVQIWDAIGNTPLLKIKSLSELTGCEIWAKAEFMNPGGSIKDRAAKFIIASAEKDGSLQPGFAIYEGTAGNTGIGLAMLAAERGYKPVITIPSNQSQEKFTTLEALGAELVKLKPVPFNDENHFYHQAKKLSEKNRNSFWANQFENPANYLAHYQGTAPEIWTQTQGHIDIFVCSVGTGGTMGGVSAYLKEKNKNIQIHLADPFGSGLYSLIKTGKIASSGSSITEGIGIMRVTANFRRAEVDDALQVTDEQMISMLYHVAHNDGLLVGTSAALNLFAAYKLALKHQNSKKVIVTMLCDSATRYQSKVLNSDWLKSTGLLVQAIQSLV